MQLENKCGKINEILKEGGKNMEERILAKLEEMNEIFKGRFNEMNRKIEDMDQKFNGKIDEMDQKFEGKIDEMNQKFERKIDELQEEIREIRNRQLVFEYEYGTKIDAIFDAVTLELDKNLEKSEKIRKLENRMDRNEVTMFGYEKRISSLELNR